jgi:hypothetical protein
MPEVVIQGQSANAGFARSGGLGLPPGGTVGAPGGEANYAAGVAPWTGDGWVAQSMARHADRANYVTGVSPWGVAGVNPYAGSPSLLGVRPFGAAGVDPWGAGNMSSVAPWTGSPSLLGVAPFGAAGVRPFGAAGVRPFGAAGVNPYAGSPSLLGVDPYAGSPSLLGVSPFGAGNMSGLRPGGGSSLISPMAGASSPSMSFMQPPEMVLTNALANALGRSPLTGSAYGSVLYNLNRMREDDDIIAQRSAAQRSSVDGMWRDSFRWAPSSMDPPTMPAPPGGWAGGVAPLGVPAFLRNQRNGGGDGGGGGGGGGSGGGGGGGGFAVPFAGAFGFGATSRLLTGSLTAGVAAAAAEELAFAPQTFGHLEGGAVAAATPYRNLVFDSYALARAGGFSGQGLLDSVDQGVVSPEWMEKLGLGPTEAIRMLSGFGIAQGSNPANQSLIQGIAGMQFTPAFSGLNLEGSVSQAARYGVVSGNAGGVEQYTQQMAPVLTIAVQQGFDKSALAQSIDTAVKMQGMSGAGGVGFDMGAFGKFLLDYKDLPGGRTGEAGLDAAQRLQQGLAGVGHDANDTFTYLNLEKNIRTPAQLKTFLNSNPDQPNYYQSIMDNPVTSQMVQYYFDLQAQGNDIGAEMYLSQIVGGGGTQGVPGNSGLARNAFLTSPAYRQMQQASPGMGPLATGITHQTPGETIAGQQAAQAQGRRPRTLSAVGRPDSHDVGAALPPIVEAEVRRAAVAAGLDPDHMVRLARQEGGSYERNGIIYGNTSRAGAFGVMQLMPGNMDEGGISRASPWQDNVRVGNQQYAALLKTYLKDHTSEEAYVLADAAYNAGPNNRGVKRFAATGDSSLLPAETKDYIHRIDSYGVPSGPSGIQSGANPSASGQNMPPAEWLTAYSDALAGAMKGSETSFSEMNGILHDVNQSLANLAKNLNKANQKWTPAVPSLLDHSLTPQ